MKYLAVILAFCILIFPAFTQTAKPALSKNTKPKPSPSKTKPTAKNQSKPKTTATPAKTTTAVKTQAKPKASATSSKSTTAGKQPKAAPTPKPVVDEESEYDKAIANTDLSERIAALKKFVKNFPKSEHNAEAIDLIVRTQAESAGASLKSGDLPNAVKLFRAAINDTPLPVPDQLFADVLSNIPPALFWRGERATAVELATILEGKCAANAGQMLGIAGFYLSVENGAEAKRIANGVLVTDPASSPAYQTLGLANRIDFQLDESAVAYSKALELDPESVTSRRGLAELKRATGKSDEAVELYRQILAKDEASIPAQTGLALSLLEADKRTEAESVMAASLAQNPGNVMLLAGAAYWYAAHAEGKLAIDLAKRAIATDARFIWSHIALARGYMAERQPLDAEKTLLAARRYGNFPTLEYEIASSRVMAGFYREAAEELTKSFSVKDGVISTRLGGRIERGSADFTELVSFERRASISAPTAADSPENAERLKHLLELWTGLNAKDAAIEPVSKAADDFTRGDDPTRLHRLLFTAKELLERKVALPKALELSKAAIGGADTALDVPSPSAAVMADELYDSRRLAIGKDEYLRVPDVPRATLLNILRGRIEDLNGRALFESDNTAEAVIRLKRAISVLPNGSTWWRTSAWRLGSALAADGKGAEALDIYIKCYKAGQPDIIRYSVIASLYQRINGNLDGLEAKIGPNPGSGSQTVAKLTEPSPTPGTSIGAVPDIKPSPETTPTPEAAKVEPTPEPSPTPTPEEAKKVEPSPSPTVEVAKIEPTPEPSPTPTPETAKVEPSPTPTPETTNVEPTPTPETTKVDPTPEPTPTPESVKVEPTPTPSPETTPPGNLVAKTDVPATDKGTEKPGDTTVPKTDSKELFPPVIITIPAPDTAVKKPPTDSVKTDATTKPTDTATVETQPDQNRPEKQVDEKAQSTDARPRIVDDKPAPLPTTCSLTLSEAALTLQNNGGDLAVILGTDDDRDIAEIKAVSSDPADVEVRREPIAGIKGRALFVISSVSSRTGAYKVTFTLPCGQKELPVRVR